MRILLAYKTTGRTAADPYTSLLPVGLGSICALLRREGITARLANFSPFSWERTEALLADEKPDLIGISQFTHNRFAALRLAELAKRMNPLCHVVLGGPHATHRSRELLAGFPQVDGVVLGEGEETFLELARHLQQSGARDLTAIRGLACRRRGEIVVTPPRPTISDLDTLPSAVSCYDDAIGVDRQRQMEFIITSRGCPATCRFCSSPLFWGRSLRFRSPRAIVDELRTIRDKYGLIYFSLRDDTFTADRQRVLEFCHLLVEERLHILWNCQSRVTSVDEEMLSWMKRAGCECVQYGVESGSERILASLGKRITPSQIRQAAAATRRVGLHLSIYLITGVPGETDEDLQTTLRLIDDIKPHDGQVSPLACYPGTSLFADIVTSGACSSDMFEKDHREAFYLRDDPFVALSTRKLLGRLTRTATRSRFRPADFAAQKRLLGFCHATNLMSGEQYEAEGNRFRAEREYREIIERQPDNPWGWLAIGEMYGGLGEVAEAEEAFRCVLELVPAHAPACVALGELCRLRGDRHQAEAWYQRALSLAPGEPTALAGLKLLAK
ncbi:B12-binding domain-containing radical SAM protein [Geobacter sp. AOG1]|uniref:B12-binding domain-containing radical SAM protein n=1 Tax=Geobacter sp. AOG1 TaxID=1566346 RepID=UPI001CC6ECF1|nr:radical SAM protein [Geobacter sp. AOG1]GFE57843.1 B12-binding domain-containing radical SAM protein [Geobacter sp. AOG1]